MPHVDTHQPGSFSWFELATSDPVAAKAFYQRLFGWTVVESPMAPGSADLYTIFQKDGRDAGAGYRLREDQKGVPPHWLPYVTVESVDETAKQAATLGGTVAAPPFDVMEHGRMAVILDASHAALALWQPNKHSGAKVINEPGAFAWAELVTPDTTGAKAFYTKLFGWQSSRMPMGGQQEYTVLSVGERPIGGIFPTPAGQTIPPHWGIYFEVADCDATVAAATSQGATVILPATTMDEVGRFATLQDPQGAVFSVITSVAA